MSIRLKRTDTFLTGAELTQQLRASYRIFLLNRRPSEPGAIEKERQIPSLNNTFIPN